MKNTSIIGKKTTVFTVMMEQTKKQYVNTFLRLNRQATRNTNIPNNLDVSHLKPSVSKWLLNRPVSFTTTVKKSIRESKGFQCISLEDPGAFKIIDADEAVDPVFIMIHGNRVDCSCKTVLSIFCVVVVYWLWCVVVVLWLWLVCGCCCVVFV